ncbi:hypothetical protein [Phytoactinopolyspora limicola]|uniref:hypothetical protein n=1 Tax=Phytoactinopolyspora limicola TaxID=2715536 RepID=UPI00140E7E7A|nr:hypothetical protein [Phytoactinopolyspora limicola]
MPRARHLTTIAIAAAALTMSGCGGGSDEDRAVSAAEDFFAALAEVDAESACELNLGGDDHPLDDDHPDWDTCLTAVDTWANSVAIPVDEELPEVTFDSAEVDTSTDTASVDGDVPAMYGFPYSFDLRKVDGDWYIDGDWYR